VGILVRSMPATCSSTFTSSVPWSRAAHRRMPSDGASANPAQTTLLLPPSYHVPPCFYRTFLPLMVTGTISVAKLPSLAASCARW
jgi:hypothetical protein